MTANEFECALPYFTSAPYSTQQENEKVVRITEQYLYFDWFKKCADIFR